MSRFVEVMVVAEGASEQNFVREVLAPYMASRNIFMEAVQITKKGQKGGDVKFTRVRQDVVNFLKQRTDLYVSTFVDYYGVKEWPGLEAVRSLHVPSPEDIARGMNEPAVADVEKVLPDCPVKARYIPFTAIHEFEALLFSDVGILADELGIDADLPGRALAECGSPERINTGYETAPSRRLLEWTDGRYAKASRGIAIARSIGIDKMRQACPNFNAWLCALERLLQD